MKHPLWIFNSALALLFIIVLLFVTFSRQQRPYREPISPEPVSADQLKQSAVTVNISKIYERDPFDTYEKEEKKTTPIVSIPVPQPPVPTVTKAPELPQPAFLDPLNISLKGIIFIVGQEDKSRAIIQDKQTSRETTYKVGNQIEDAQLIRIFNNKIVLLRTNGQQEVIYLREKDAQQDPAFNTLGKWEDVVKKINDTTFTLNPHTFTQRIENLSQFIDMLDLTTAYQKGINIGCRVGNVEKDSLGQSLGLESGDIITSVDDIPATTTADRFKIYKEIINKKDGAAITVNLLRKRKPLTLVYSLEKFSTLNTRSVVDPAQELRLQEAMQEKQLKAIDTKRTIAPVTNDIKRLERANMRNFAERATHPKRT
jgi:type II secretory pathway component PulC